MRHRLFTLFLFLICFSTVNAQEKLNPLTTPSSPASSILGIEPSTVLAPKSYQALETAIYSDFLNNEGLTLPDNFSLEFSPYWIKDHKLSLDDYLFPKNFIEQVKRNSSFSLASTQSFILGDSTKTNSLAFGYRVSFYLGSKKDQDKIGVLKNQLNFDMDVHTDVISKALVVLNDPQNKNKDSKELWGIMKPEITQVLKDHKIEKELINGFIEKLKLKFENLELSVSNVTDAMGNTYRDYFKSETYVEKIEEYIKNRYGLHLDVAYANFLNFPTKKFEFSIVPKQSVWLTPSYRFSGDLNKFKLIGVLRYQWNNTDYYEKYFSSNKLYKNNIDYGLAVNGDFKKLTIQFEMVGRNSNTEIEIGKDNNNNSLYRKEKDSDVQYMGTLAYRLTDQVVLSYTLGKNFQLFASKDDNLISLLSLNFGFGTPSKKSVTID